MKRSVFVRSLVFPLMAVLMLTVSGVAQEQPVINVSNVEGLYAAALVQKNNSDRIL